MGSNNKRTSPRERQFIRFLDTVQKMGNEPAIDKLDDTLSELVPPVRVDAAESGHNGANKLHEP